MRPVSLAATVGLAAVLVGCGGDATGPAGQLVGDVSDPTGDAFDEDSPDITRARVRVLGDQVEFMAVFRAATFSEETTRVQFAIDIDENAATGDEHGASPDLGIDILVNLGTPHGNGVQVLQHDGTPNGYQVVADLSTLTTTNNRLIGSVPIAVFGDDGHLAFRALSSTYLGSGSSTGIVDRAPESDVPAARVD